MKFLPKARMSELVVQSLDKEVLIYDLATHRAYHLNETAGTVYLACNGTTALAELKRKYRFTDGLIHLALDELKKENLLEEDYRSPFGSISRRSVIRRVGLASMTALPAISSLMAPTAASAQSRVNRSACTAGSCPDSRPVCATSGGAAGQCCTFGSTRRQADNTVLVIVTNELGTCAESNCNTSFPNRAAECCSGSLTTSCTQVTATRYNYTCTCSA